MERCEQALIPNEVEKESFDLTDEQESDFIPEIKEMSWIIYDLNA